MLLLFFSMCASLQKQAPACCKYVQVLCKLLIDGGDDRKHNTKTESGIYVNFSLTNKKLFEMYHHVWTLGRDTKSLVKNFYSVKVQWELATSRARRSTLRAQGEKTVQLW